MQEQETYVLYKFYKYFGRMGDLEGYFISTPSYAASRIGRAIWFGEVLGKHSDIRFTLEDGDIVVHSNKPSDIRTFYSSFGSSSGHNPLDYVYDEDTCDVEECPDVVLPEGYGINFDFEELQTQQSAWAEYNFGATEVGTDAARERAIHTFLGVAEEVGELSHALLKEHQGIRKNEDHAANAQDAIGDIMIYLADLCSRRGWSLQECAEKAWGEVKLRDWKKYPKNGKSE